MSNLGLKSLVILAIVGLSACSANHNSIYRDLKTSAGTGALVDIKQRAIVAGERKGNKPEDKINVVCAEPSPDSLSAYAAEIAAKADTGKGVSAEVATAFQESAAFVGLRTQSIQLLRDAMYRSCEAYMNGAISESQYSVLARRYQKHAIALLAIESLTGTVKAPAVTINTSGSAGNTRPLSEMTDEALRIDGLIDTKESEIKNEEAKADGSKDDTNIKKLKVELASLKNYKLLVLAGLENPQSGQVTGAALAAVAAVTETSKLSDTSTAKIAETVENIVRGITENDETAALCFDVLANQKWDEKTKSYLESKVIIYCNSYLTNLNRCQELKIEILQNQKGGKVITPDLEKKTDAACNSGGIQRIQSVQPEKAK